MNVEGRIWPMGGAELGWRGLIAQSTDLDALAAEAATGPSFLPAARPA